mgnify:CR=1 FL=1
MEIDKIVELLFSLLPAVIVGTIAYYFFKQHMENESGRRRFLLQKDMQKEKQFAELNKISEKADFPIPRISKFVPPNGKPSVNNAWKGFMEFVDTVYDDGGLIKTSEFPTKKGKPCDWCEFKHRKQCPIWQ